MPPAETQLSVLIRIDQNLKAIAGNGTRLAAAAERIAEALEELARKTPNPDGSN